MVTATDVIDSSGISVDATGFHGVTFSEMPWTMHTMIGSRADAITFGKRVFVHPGTFDDVVSGARPDLVIHELAHVAQWQTDGASFLPRYLVQYLRFRLLGVSHQAAYRAISYEMEAYAAAEES